MYPGEGEDYVFHGAAGTPMDPDNRHGREFQPILDAAGVRRVGIRALRHTYASFLINQGESIKFVSRHFGHASLQLTADLYGHLFKETSAVAMRRLEAQMAGASGIKTESRKKEGVRPKP